MVCLWCGRTVGRSVGHVITKFSGMGRFIYPWCSAGTLRARSSATNQGKEAENLSRERRSRWISAISRDDLTDDILENDGVCRRYFVSGKAAKGWDRFNVDWVPTLCLGHSKNAVGPKNLEKVAGRSQRARGCEQIKRPAQEQS